MKALLTCSFFIGCSFFVQAQTYYSSCVPSGSMQSIYRNDASLLAIKRMHEINSPFMDSITIPQIFIDSIENALYAVDNMQNALVADTLRQLFGYTNFAPGSDSTHIVSASSDLEDAFALKQVNVVVDNATNWGAQWLSGNYNATGNDSVNYLINNYHLRVIPDQYQIYPTRTTYIIRSPFAINAAALARQFEHISGVGPGYAEAYHSASGGNGNIIQAEFTANTIMLSYTFGCGDCPSGCTFGRTWHFKIHTAADCSVDYISVENWGPPVLWLSGQCLDYLVTTVLCPSGSATLYPNLDGNDSYQWQVSTDGKTFSDISDNSNYSGTNTAILNLTNIPSSWYGNIYTCLSNGNRSKVTFRIKFINTWNSVSDTAWENAGNWSCGTLPDMNTDVVINKGTIALNSDATVRTMTIAAGATLNIAPGVHLSILH